MRTADALGIVYRCPICGAELTVVSFKSGAFAPRCCHTAMVRLEGRTSFYRCPVCGAMVAVVHPGEDSLFAPRCCNTAMLRVAA